MAYDAEILVVGCGNVLFKDDGFGPATINVIEQKQCNNACANEVNGKVICIRTYNHEQQKEENTTKENVTALERSPSNI